MRERPVRPAVHALRSRRMSLVWIALNEAWVAIGWPLPEGRSVAEEFHGGAEYQFAVDDHRWVGVARRFDADEVVGFFHPFATCLDERDPEDQDVRDPGVRARPADVLATRAGFDARHREAAARLTARSGVPHLVGTHDDEWHHAAWRVGDRLVVPAQGGNSDTCGLADDACPWVVRHAADQPVPTGDALYAFLCGDSAPA
ncbi:hypothetical protein LZG04_28375 [Saccharothrix sp. S26]|uniref:hypothetical protein n=1 Tax=Saccharothrix sp. S26 TaxID=2907215 RepID=UPI001F1F58A2|nr:hypothetical protein [Saccharothrix sp. S26]MCE6998683.1 hypothetical protein [Saccharothrix sp. S26]